MQFYRSYQFRIYPTSEQKTQLGKIFSSVHFTHNVLLQAWMQDPRLDLSFELEKLIRRNPWLEFIDHSILEHVVRNLEKFCPKGPLPDQPAHGSSCRSAALPRFKTSGDAWASFTISSSHNICIGNGCLALGGQRGLHPIRMVLSRSLPEGAHICSATITRRPQGEYYVSLLCRFLQSPAHPSTRPRAIGLVFSPDTFCASSDPALLPDRNALNGIAQTCARLGPARIRLAGMVPGSRNCGKQRRRIAGLRDRLSRQIGDYLQKQSTWIADRYGIVCMEIPSAAEPDDTLSESAVLLRDSWQQFARMLEYKLAERGGTVIRISRWTPVRITCHECGALQSSPDESAPEWICPRCGSVNARDYSASLNIREEGLRRLRQAASADWARRNRPFRDGYAVSSGTGDFSAAAADPAGSFRQGRLLRETPSVYSYEGYLDGELDRELQRMRADLPLYITSEEETRHLRHRLQQEDAGGSG